MQIDNVPELSDSSFPGIRMTPGRIIGVITGLVFVVGLPVYQMLPIFEPHLLDYSTSYQSHQQHWEIVGTIGWGGTLGVSSPKSEAPFYWQAPFDMTIPDPDRSITHQDIKHDLDFDTLFKNSQIKIHAWNTLVYFSKLSLGGIFMGLLIAYSINRFLRKEQQNTLPQA